MENFGYVKASYVVFKDNELNYIYHRKTSAPDSGWRFFSGKEKPIELDVPGAIEIVSVNSIFSRFPEVAKFVKDRDDNVTFKRLADGSWAESEFEELPW